MNEFEEHCYYCDDKGTVGCTVERASQSDIPEDIKSVTYVLCQLCRDGVMSIREALKEMDQT